MKSLDNKKVIPLYNEKSEDFIPFSFPVLVDERDRFRKYLMEHKIYCAVHWPMETKEQCEIKTNMELTKHMLSLPLDQRYDLEHMKYMVEIVNEFK